MAVNEPFVIVERDGVFDVRYFGKALASDLATRDEAVDACLREANAIVAATHDLATSLSSRAADIRRFGPGSSRSRGYAAHVCASISASLFAVLRR